MPYIKTQKCVEKAKGLIADSPDAHSMAYATLQLRMGVEYLFYEIRNLYRDELPPITTKWQPQRVIEEALACDPDADKDGFFSVGTGGYTADSTPALTLKTMAPNKKMLRKHHHRLGKYLHAPVDLIPHDASKWLAHLNETIAVLEAFQQSQGLCGLRPIVTINCTCGQKIVQSRHRVESTGQMQCLDPHCGEIFDVMLGENQIKATPRREGFECPKCKSAGFVSAGSIREGMSIECQSCHDKFTAKATLVLVPEE